MWWLVLIAYVSVMVPAFKVGVRRRIAYYEREYTFIEPSPVGTVFVALWFAAFWPITAPCVFVRELIHAYAADSKLFMTNRALAEKEREKKAELERQLREAERIIAEFDNRTSERASVAGSDKRLSDAEIIARRNPHLSEEEIIERLFRGRN